MLNAETKRHIDAARDVLVGVAPNPMTQIDQITYALIYKFMDDMDQSAIKAGGEPSFFVGELEQFAWSKLIDTRMGNQEKMNLYGEALSKFAEAKQLPELFRMIFRAAFLPYRSPETLGLFLKEINYFDYTHPEELGNAYEYLLSIMSAQGDAGQFRTPRHIIDFMVNVINPTKDDKILDPACGTGGFLVSSYNRILAQHDGKDDLKKIEKPLTPDERKKLMGNFEGYDIDPSMVRISQVNMYLHQFKNPKIFQYDTLTNEERWNDKFDVILANPPFMSPKGGIKPHNKFGIQSNRSEVLFVDYITNHLKPNGRAGIIVPEGIIFQSGKAYKELRKALVEGGLYAVVSLPSGVFQPYSGVKTSILLINPKVSKQRSEIAFIKIAADGYDLGASKRPVDKNDLPEALAGIQKWEKGERLESPLLTFVSKDKISDNDDYSLSGDRYKDDLDHSNASWPMVKLQDSMTLNFGDRITKKNELGSKYPVYGGGGESFRTDNFNRQDELVIARFAMGPNCVRYVQGQFWLMDSGATVEINESYKSEILIEYLGHILINMQDEIYRCARGGAQKNLHLEMFYEIEIPLPPLEVQRQIVAELDGYAAIIEGANQVVENWKPTIDALSGFEFVELGDLCSIQNGYAFKSTEMGDFQEGFLPVVKIGNVKADGTIDPEFKYHKFQDQLENFILAEGDIVIAMTGATVGKVASMPKGRFLLNQRVGRINLENKELTADFLRIALQSNKFYNYCQITATGGAQGNISSENILKFKLPLPPIAAQVELGAAVSKERSAIESMKDMIETYRTRSGVTIERLWSA